MPSLRIDSSRRGRNGAGFAIVHRIGDGVYRGLAGLVPAGPGLDLGIDGTTEVVPFPSSFAGGTPAATFLLQHFQGAAGSVYGFAFFGG
jgi:hypothetical protein